VEEERQRTGLGDVVADCDGRVDRSVEPLASGFGQSPYVDAARSVVCPKVISGSGIGGRLMRQQCVVSVYTRVVLYRQVSPEPDLRLGDRG
jgi:hypothetical protein